MSNIFSTKSLRIVLIFSSILNLSSSIIYSYNDSRIHYFGRYYTDSQGLKYDWPCFTIEFCFSNTSKVWWLGHDTFSHYSIILNQNHNQTIIPKSQSRILIYDGKSQTTETNCIKIVKITEDHFGPLGTSKDSVFKGVQLEGNGNLIYKQYNFKYKLQFVGDSLTAAYGDMSGTNIKCFLRMRHNQNCLFSWATILSKKLNAEYRIQAQSGKGIIKNSFGVPGKVMPTLFTQITSNSKVNSYHYQDGYNPDAVLVFLGINDHNSLIKPAPDSFIFAYQKFLNQILLMQIDPSKKTKLLVLCSGDFPAEVCEYTKTAVKSFKYAYAYTYYVEVPSGIFVKGNMGCIGHPNAKGQALIAESIYETVNKILQS